MSWYVWLPELLRHCGNHICLCKQEDEDEIEIEINAIESKTLMDLIAWATKCISKRKKS